MPQIFRYNGVYYADETQFAPVTGNCRTPLTGTAQCRPPSLAVIVILANGVPALHPVRELRDSDPDFAAIWAEIQSLPNAPEGDFPELPIPGVP